jgi:dihydrofolate reductase
MRRLKLQMQVTVDGFNSEGQDDGVDWGEIKGYSRDLLDGCDTIVLGRKTAVDFIPYWDKAAGTPGEAWHEIAQRIASSRKIVFSKTLDRSDWPNTSIEQGDLAEEIRRLKSTSGKDIIVYGGTSFVSSLIKEALIDEFHLFLNPIALGTGAPIFGGLERPQKLKLVKSIAYNCGLVLLHYEAK